LNLLKQNISKKYYKFQNMLADLGGLLKGVISIAVFINWYFCNKHFYNEIINANINSLVETEAAKTNNRTSSMRSLVSKKTNSGSKIPSSPIKDMNPEGRTNLRKSSPGSSSKKKDFIEEGEKLEFDSPKNYHKKSDKGVKLSVVSQAGGSSKNGVRLSTTKNFKKTTFGLYCTELMLPMCCFNKSSPSFKRLSTHHKYREIINSQLDILTMLNKFHAVDKISYVLAGEKNKYVIDNCSNPYVNTDDTLPETSEIFQLSEIVMNRLREQKTIA
jgi:hypothetical protein